MHFHQLPEGSQKALIHYFLLESGSDQLGDLAQSIELGNISDHTWPVLIERASEIWAGRAFSLSFLPADKAGDFVEKHSPDVMEDHDGFEGYRKAMMRDPYIPHHIDTSWPVLAMPSCGEALLDGWHRFNSYLNQGVSGIFFVNLDDAAIAENADYQVAYGSI